MPVQFFESSAIGKIGRCQLLIFSRIDYSCCEEGFLALDASAAFAAVLGAAFVARPCFAVVDAEGFAFSGNVALGEAGVGSMDFDVGVCAIVHGLAHGGDEGGAAVGIDGVVAAMIGYHHTFQSSTFGNATSDGEHDAIAKRYNGRSHVLCCIMPLGNGGCAFEQGGFEILVHESKRNGDMRNAQPFAVHFCQRYFTSIVVAAIVERDAKRYGILVVVEHGYRVHAARNNNHRIFHTFIQSSILFMTRTASSLNYCISEQKIVSLRQNEKN